MRATRAASRSLRPAVALAVFAAALLTSDVSPAALASGNFAPTSTLTLSSSAASANADIVTTSTNPGGDLVGGAIPASPPGVCVAASPPGAGACTGGAQPEVGDVAGTVSSNTGLGILNSPCSPPAFNNDFVLLMATTDNSAGNLIYPSQAWENGPENSLGPLRDDVNTVSPDSDPGAPNTTGSAGPGSAVSPMNGLPAHVDLYPAYLNDVFDPDGPGGAAPIVPLARYSGSIIVSTLAIVISVPVFSPGALGGFAAPNPLADIADPALGYAAIPVLNNPNGTPAPSPITDLCTPTSITTNLFGITHTNSCKVTPASCPSDVAINSPSSGGAPTGRARYANPATAGTHLFFSLSTSARDLDLDGLENSLDTCPYTATPGYNPRVSDLVNDADSDMLPGGGPAGGCDPTPATNTNSGDHDGDGWLNAGDNCPLVYNPSNNEDETLEEDRVSRPRGGSASDSLGNECDVSENADCYDAVDDDGDTLVNDGCPQIASFPESGVGGCGDVIDANDEDPSPTFSTDDEVINDGCPTAGTAPEINATCLNATDDDGPDGLVNDGCPVTGTGAGGGAETACAGDSTDSDSDGWTNDGCAANPAGTASENGFCTDAIDNDADTVINDGCPGGPAAAGPGLLVEGVLPVHADCADPDDDDGDGTVNDGCPQYGPSETGCLAAFDDDADTVVNEGCPSSSRVANGHYHTALNEHPQCIGGTDGDGWCDLAGTNLVLDDPDDGNAARTPEHYARHRAFFVAHSGSGNAPPQREPAGVCFDGVDNDGDTFTDLQEPDGPDNTGGGDGSTSSNLWDCAPRAADRAGADTDGDGTSDKAEIFIGTDALGRCERGGPIGTGLLASGDWPPDISAVTVPSSRDRVNIGDSSLLNNDWSGSGPTVTPPGNSLYIQRVDLVPGPASFAPTVASWIGLPDLQAMFNTLPPMFSGAVYTKGRLCSSHPLLND